MTPREFSLGILDGRRQAEKIELVCQETDSGPEVQLRLLAWGEGIGWYSQRTLPLPSDLAGLRALLRRAEHLPRRQSPRADALANILPFPERRSVRLSRPASA